jgi:hypothetical protein
MLQPNGPASAAYKRPDSFAKLSGHGWPGGLQTARPNADPASRFPMRALPGSARS